MIAYHIGATLNLPEREKGARSVIIAHIVKDCFAPLE